MKTNEIKQLNEKALKAICPGATPFELYHHEIKGLLARVQPTGRITFYYTYRGPDNVRRRVRLGNYGDITLTQARDLAKRHAGAVASGIDPHKAKQAARRIEKKIEMETLGGFVIGFYAPWVKLHRKSADHRRDSEVAKSAT
jgi:hypothetical protein